MRRSYPSNPLKATKQPSQDVLNLPLDLTWDKTHNFSIYSSHFWEKDLGLSNSFGIYYFCYSLWLSNYFEPISEIPYKLLTLKTVFVTLLHQAQEEGKSMLLHTGLWHMQQTGQTLCCVLSHFWDPTEDQRSILTRTYHHLLFGPHPRSWSSRGQMPLPSEMFEGLSFEDEEREGFSSFPLEE